MEAVTSAPQPQQPTHGHTRAPRSRRPRRGRGNHAQSASTSTAETTARHTLPHAHSTSATTDTPTAAGQTANTSARGRGRGRGRGVRPIPGRTVNGRQFGGQLTRHDTNTTTDSTHLHADAAEFVPGRQYDSKAPQSHSHPHQKPHLPQKRRMSKSQAPDIATRTHEDIDRNLYECPICTSEVRRNSKVWSCHTCWTVFHLTCIKKWSANEGSTAAQQNAQDGEIPPPRQWRCPGCNLPKHETPKLYSCWCGKETDPKPPAGIPPHSCGNTCAKERARLCPHPCELTCHAGPCPPCNHMGPTQICFCGKHEVTKRCSETNYDTGWSCGELCGEVMPCGEHTCDRPCHEGLCGACETRVYARCYCGQIEKDVLCDNRGEERESSCNHPTGDAEPVAESWTGSFDCGQICGREFDCGKHFCEKKCHTQDLEPDHCPRSPDVVTHCPCEKTSLASLSETPRNNCSDPVPHCKQRCGKVLPCGHEDEQLCHTGSCMPCTKTVDIKCRCGRTTSKTICHQGQEEAPQCARVCKILLNCSRHQCDERCCPGERKATERQSTKRKQRPLGAVTRSLDADFEAEHICTLQCGRLLKCGTHHCAELCHRGQCGTCREAIFDDVSCHCGRTVLQPPLPCGTKPPPCRYPCTRPKTCGHPQVAHNCHQDDEACPKCPYLLEKRCMCSKKAVKNQPCWLQDVRCGEICGRILKCGSHHCRKTCHRPGECEDADGKPCQQLCGKAKRVCDHPDIENTCHAPFACKEDKACQNKIFITCECQAQKQEMRCGASKNGEGNLGKTLPCNDECARLERNRKLAVALNIDQTAHVEGGDHIPYSTETLTLFSEHSKWGQTQEREFRVFASSAEEKRMRFKPMQASLRAFIHSLAEDFGLDSESMDPEPHRHVMIWKTPRFVAAPNKTLADALRLRQAQRAANASANVSDNESQMQQKQRMANANTPFNSFVIGNPRFGLTVDELRTEINQILTPETAVTFEIDFLPNDSVVLKAVSRTLDDQELQQSLQNIKIQITTAIGSKGYGAPELSSVDRSSNVVRRESDAAAGEGWSKVAAKKSAPKTVIQPTGARTGNNAFSALTGNKVTFAKKKPGPARMKKQAVVDDWEAAELAEEEKERATSGASGDESPPLSEGDGQESLELVEDLPQEIDIDSETVIEGQASTNSPPESSDPAAESEEKSQ